MASFRCAASSPASPQLRFGRRRREPFDAALIRFRFRPPGSRCVVLASAEGNADVNRGEPLQSLTPSNGSTDAFAGWSDAGEPEKNGGGFGRIHPRKIGRYLEIYNNTFLGMIGVTLAGLLFTAGVTFAALSLANKNTSGGKQKMEPLTKEQEVLVTSDDIIGKQIDDESSVMMSVIESKTSNCNPDYETGTIQNPIHPKEIIKDASESRPDDMQNTQNSLLENGKSVSNDADVSASGHDDLATVQDVSSSDVVFSTTYAADFSSDKNTKVSDEYIEDVVNFRSIATTVDLTSIDTDAKEIILNTETPSSFTGVFEDVLSGNPLASHSETIESGDHINSLDVTNLAATEASVPEDQDVDQNDVLQLLDEGSTDHPIVSETEEAVPSGISVNLESDSSEKLMHHSVDSLEEYKSNGNTSFLRNPISDSSYPSKQVPVSDHDKESHNSFFESTIPKKSSTHSGIPAPSLLSAVPQLPPGKVLVPPLVDQVQGQALAALQVLTVIEADAQPGDLCTRREYARWLLSASNVLSRNAVSKVYPAMFVENVTELAFDDIGPEDPDFPYIQGLAEAGLISSKLSMSDLTGSFNSNQDYVCFYPDRPVSRQDLVSWKMALDSKQPPEVDKNLLYKCTGFIDIEKITEDVWPALVADIAAGEQSIVALAFGYTRLFQPDKPVTKAQVAIALATGDAAEVVTEELARIEAEALAETAVNAHTALVAQVEKDLNSSFEKELAREKEKTEALEKLAEEARIELDRLRTHREEENTALMKGRAAVESEIEVLSKIRHDMEEQLQSLVSDKLAISYEKERINRLRSEAESENQKIVQLQYELEVERKALSMAKAWAEEEAKRAREQAKALEEARERWEGHGIKVVVSEELQNDASIGTTWQTVGEQPLVDETIVRGESLLEKLKGMAAEIKLRSSSVIEKIIQRIVSLVSDLKEQASETSKHAVDLRNALVSKAKNSVDEIQENASSFSSAIRDRARRVAEDCKEGVGRISQKFKT